MTTILRKSALAAAALCLANFAPDARADENDSVTWVVAPYIWAATVSTDLNTEIPPFTDGNNQREFVDILDLLDGAFQGHVEAQGDKFGFFGDFTYIGLADDHSRERFSSDSDLDTYLIELAAVWSPGEDRFHGLDLFAGIRYFDVDFSARLDPVNPDFSTVTIDHDTDFTDFMIGGRYSWQLSDRWGVTTRADTSFGDTDGTWNLSVVFEYRMGNGAWLLGYRYLDVGLEVDQNDIDITLSGPIIGYGFIF